MVPDTKLSNGTQGIGTTIPQIINVQHESQIAQATAP
jgi:hypothetical protein